MTLLDNFKSYLNQARRYKHYEAIELLKKIIIFQEKYYDNQRLSLTEYKNYETYRDKFDILYYKFYSNR